MNAFFLYRSGIHDATITFNVDEVLYQERDVHKNQWHDEIKLTAKKAKDLEDYYHINPKTIHKQIEEFGVVFQTEEQKVVTPWGATYQKHEEDEHLWVEREKKFPLDVVMVNREPVAFISPSRETCSVLVKSGFETYTPVKLWNDGKVSQAKYGVKHLDNFMVKMRDGIKLSTAVWLPNKVEEEVPVILVRTPYGKMAYEKAYIHFIQRGYAIVVQDTRGRQDSEGEWIPMYSEVEDGDDTLNWIAKQCWCDGNIGMIGASYGGFVQWAAAASGNPHLKALVSIVTAGSPFIDIPRKGGSLVSGMLAWTFAMAEKEFKPENMLRTDWDDILKIRPLLDIPKKALGKNVPFWNYWMAHPTNDGFWRKADWYQHKSNINVPAMIVSGWYDDNGMGTTEALEVVADFANEDKKVILGPWMHNANTTRDIQGVRFGNNALRYDLDLYYQQWFDRKLKFIDNRIDATPPVEYYVVGENKWATAKQWPPEHVEWSNMYLNSKGNACSSQGNGSLLFAPSSINETCDEFVYDPTNPAPHLIDISENEIGAPANYKVVEEREDVLVYDSAPLESPMTIVGDVSVKFYASSSARDTDWIVRLTDVDPEGNSIKLADGVLRARYRNGFDQENLLEPGKVEGYLIRTSKIANTFKKGHQIRLTITSSAENFIFPNTNTGEDPAVDVDIIKAEQRVYHTADFLSHVQLPVIK